MKKKNAIVFSVTFVITLAVLVGVYYALNTSFLAQKPDDAADSSVAAGVSSEMPVKNAGETTNFLLCGLDESESLTDVIMVVQLDPQKNEVNVLQIPRDTYVGIDRYSTGKINAVYASKKKGSTPIGKLIDEIDHTFKLPIDHYATVNIPGLRKIVDSMGGVEVDIPQDIYFTPGETIKKGKQTLNGEKAEWFVRYRAGYYNGDIGRMHAQSIFLEACANKALQMSNTQILSLLTQDYKNITTDLTIAQMMGYYGSIRSLKPENIHFYALEGSGLMHESYSVYSLDKQKAADLLNQYFRPGSEPVPAEDLNIIELEAEQTIAQGTTDDKQSEMTEQ